MPPPKEYQTAVQRAVSDLLLKHHVMHTHKLPLGEFEPRSPHYHISSPPPLQHTTSAVIKTADCRRIDWVQNWPALESPGTYSAWPPSQCAASCVRLLGTKNQPQSFIGLKHTVVGAAAPPTNELRVSNAIFAETCGRILPTPWPWSRTAPSSQPSSQPSRQNFHN